MLVLVITVTVQALLPSGLFYPFLLLMATSIKWILCASSILQDSQDQTKPFGKPPGTKHFVIAHTSQLFSTLLISELPKYNNSQSCLQLKGLAYNGICHTN